jgi:uncharacterized protein YkwD
MRRPSRSRAINTPAPANLDLPTALLAAHNAARAEAGLPPLRANAQLQAAAASWAAALASFGFLIHGPTFWRIRRNGYGFSEAAENIAEGQPDAAAVVAAWMADPGHRANILGPYVDFGGAAASARKGTVYWCADYGTPAG